MIRKNAPGKRIWGKRIWGRRTWARPPLILAILVLVSLAGCTEFRGSELSKQGPTGDGRYGFRPVDMTDLPGWNQADFTQAVQAFLRTCPIISRKADSFSGAFGTGSAQTWGSAQAWTRVCAEAASLAAKKFDNKAAQEFFQTRFTAYAITDNNGDQGLLTGYYEPELRGSRRPSRQYATPLYRRPDDLISLDLGRFRPDLRGRRLAGRLVEGRLIPYDSRAEIARGALKGRGLELLWVDNPLDAFFLQVQGSGRIRLPDNTIVRVSYAGDNGFPYVSIGRELARRGAIHNVTLESIRSWVANHPTQMRALLDSNPSYVFFREVSAEPGTDTPSGAAGVPLTPGHSLAIDDGIYPYGVPIWIDGRDPLDPKGRALQRMTITQDTGGALKGILRGDLFWGHGRLAERKAGRMRDRAAYYIFLPRETGGSGRADR